MAMFSASLKCRSHVHRKLEMMEAASRISKRKGGPKIEGYQERSGSLHRPTFWLPKTKNAATGAADANAGQSITIQRVYQDWFLLSAMTRLGIGAITADK